MENITIHNIEWDKITIPYAYYEQYLTNQDILEICNTVKQQLNSLDNLDNLDNFEVEINHGVYGGLLFRSNNDLANYLSCIEYLGGVGIDSTMYSLQDVYTKINDGIYFVARDLANEYLHNIIEHIEGLK